MHQPQLPRQSPCQPNLRPAHPPTVDTTLRRMPPHQPAQAFSDGSKSCLLKSLLRQSRHPKHPLQKQTPAAMDAVAAMPTVVQAALPTDALKDVTKDALKDAMKVGVTDAAHAAKVAQRADAVVAVDVAVVATPVPRAKAHRNANALKQRAAPPMPKALTQAWATNCQPKAKKHHAIAVTTGIAVRAKANAMRATTEVTAMPAVVSVQTMWEQWTPPQRAQLQTLCNKTQPNAPKAKKAQNHATHAVSVADAVVAVDEAAEEAEAMNAVHAPRALSATPLAIWALSSRHS